MINKVFSFVNVKRQDIVRDEVKMQPMLKLE
jgi:hypothetical protein